MKGILLFIVIVLLQSINVHSQVGIGTINPDNSTVLDVQSSNKGVVFPRMLETDRIAISNPATGLLVFQTNNNSGYYYYTGSEWTLINHTPNVIAFEAENPTHGTIVENGNILQFTIENYDTNNAWNGQLFTVPETGLYCFQLSQYFSATLSPSTIGANLIVNGTSVKKKDPLLILPLDITKTMNSPFITI